MLLSGEERACQLLATYSVRAVKLFETKGYLKSASPQNKQKLIRASTCRVVQKLNGSAMELYSLVAESSRINWSFDEIYSREQGNYVRYHCYFKMYDNPQKSRGNLKKRIVSNCHCSRSIISHICCCKN